MQCGRIKKTGGLQGSYFPVDDSVGTRYCRWFHFLLLEVFEGDDVLVPERGYIEPPILWVAFKVARVSRV